MCESSNGQSSTEPCKEWRSTEAETCSGRI
uniref:Uncharacterized protein n=1 Tax=Rhizophora mucronata TaxID=61149 RepID=A0A2P2Q390_RHIMU